jgi:hypothetical protein
MIRRILCAVFVLTVPLDVYAQAPLLWESEEDIQGGADLVRAITLSGRSVVVVGNGGVPSKALMSPTSSFKHSVGRTERSSGAIRLSCQQVRLSLSS